MASDARRSTAFLNSLLTATSRGWTLLVAPGGTSTSVVLHSFWRISPSSSFVLSVGHTQEASIFSRLCRRRYSENSTNVSPSISSFLHHTMRSPGILWQCMSHTASVLYQGFAFLSSWISEGALFVVLHLRIQSAAQYIAVFHGHCQWFGSRPSFLLLSHKSPLLC